LDRIPFEVDRAALLRNLRLSSSSELASQALEMASHAETIARPRALFQVAFVDDKGVDQVDLGGVVFTSRVLRVNLDQVHRVFPYVATCGTELASWYRSQEYLLHQFWAETIAEMALHAALESLRQHVMRRYGLKRLSAMAPGSLADWPLEEQRQVFQLLGDTQRIGVQLTEALLMLPTKSLSGLLFASKITFESCQLCPREQCIGRRAPYDRGLYSSRYAQGSNSVAND
jgi:hypothetical protein